MFYKAPILDEYYRHLQDEPWNANILKITQQVSQL
jgi:hypothetical protein